jgi:nucleoside-diphosphate kinase
MYKEKTLVLLKPDTIQRNLVGEVVGRFERVGLKIVAMKLLLPSKEQVHQHYVKYLEDDREIIDLGKRSIENQKKSGVEIKEEPKVVGQKIIDKLVRFLASGPVVAIVLEGNQAIAIARKIIGSTEPLRSDVGTIRGDFTVDSYILADKDNRAVRNLVHGSSNQNDAELEIKIWFKDDEICKYNNARDRILYDANLESINE